MKILHTAQDAIEQAIEGGYCRTNTFYHAEMIGNKPDVYGQIEIFLTDPLFWQALGKARGWGKFDRDTRGLIYDWQYYGTNWFSNRMVGGDETKFWESLP